MVDLRLSFWRDDRGAALSEAMITIPIVLLIFAERLIREEAFAKGFGG